MILAALIFVLVISGEPVVLHKGDPSATFPVCERVATVRAIWLSSWEETELEMARQAEKKDANLVHVRKRWFSPGEPPEYKAIGRAYRCSDEVLVRILEDAQQEEK